MKFHPDFALSVPEGDHEWIFCSPGEKEIIIAKESGSPLHAGGLPGAKYRLNRSFVIGTDGMRLICCGEMEQEIPLPEGYEWAVFREVYRHIGKEVQFPISRGKTLLSWDRAHSFCGVCGTGTEASGNEPSRICPSCGEVFYPRLSPAVIVRITRGEQIMLAHNKNFPEGIFSHIAGFVEAGESLEQAARREIQEEVGLEVENIRLFGSQSWPLPHSLMIAFTAECPVGDPEPDGVEILEARWFNRGSLPVFPPSGSIAMRMIEDYLENTDGESSG